MVPLTYHLPVVKRDDCISRGLYLMDVHPKFKCSVAVFDTNGNFVGLNGNIIRTEGHRDSGGAARPVLYLDVQCSVEDLEPFKVYNDSIEGHGEGYSGRVCINNWLLYNFLSEYEDAYIAGVLGV